MTELRVMCDLLLGQHSGFSLTLAGQTVVADDGDAEALSFHLGESNLMDLVSFEIGLKPNTHTHPLSLHVLAQSHRVLVVLIRMNSPAC